MLLLMQALFWLIAAISAIPFLVAGERAEGLLAAFTMVLAWATFAIGIGLLLRRRWARRAAIGLEVACLAGSLLLLLLPIGANHGLVTLLVNLALPAAVIVLVSGKRARQLDQGP